MNPLLLLAGLAWLQENDRSAPVHSKAEVVRRARKKSPKVPRMPKMPPMPTKTTAKHASPADHAASEHVVHKTPAHASPADHASNEQLESTLHKVPPPKKKHVLKARVVHKRKRKKRKPKVTRLPVQRITASPEPVIPVTSVADVQGILRGLGWKGRLTTKGKLSSDLTDGLYGPTTALDWQQSARKRGLDTTIERVNGTTVHVHPDTYGVLKQTARSMGAVVGIYIP